MTDIYQPHEVELVYVFESGEKDSLTVEDQVRSTHLFDPETGADVDVAVVIINGEEYDPNTVTVKWATDDGKYEVIQGVFGYDVTELEAPDGQLYYPVEVYVD